MEKKQRRKPRRWSARISIERDPAPAGHAIFVSIDSAGLPGDLNVKVLHKLELSTDFLPKPHELELGFFIKNGPAGELVCFIVTLGEQDPAEALGSNLLRCLQQLGKLRGDELWIPLMGTGSAGLSEEESLTTILRALERAGVLGDAQSSVTIAAPGHVTDAELSRLRALIRAPSGDFRDNAEMQYDRPTDEDLLGRSVFAGSLADRINLMTAGGHANDRTSLMIQLHAPWGAGKTSFMRMLGNELRSLKLKSSDDKPWTVVWFNAWENQRIDPPWWMLYETMYRTLVRSPNKSVVPASADLSNGERLHLFLREQWWRLTVGNGWNFFFIAVGVSILGVLLLKRDDTWVSYFKNVDAIFKALTAVAGLLVTVGGIVRAALSGLLVGGSKAAQGFVEMAQDPITKLRKHYEQLLAFVDRRILVCVDDLDRCSADYVVKVLEGMQTMFAHPNVVWIVAADRRWVAEAFEWKYPTSKSVAEPGNRLGYQFLEKAFQLTIALPEVNDHEKGKYWRFVVGESSLDEAEDEELTRAEKRLSQQSTESGKLNVLGQLPPELADRLVGKVIRQMRSVEIDTSVEHFLTRFSDVIKPNPRAMKRLVNSYTVYRDLAIHARLLTSGDERRREELARWAILCMDTPLLLDALEEHPEFLNGHKATPPEGLDPSLKSVWGRSRIQRLLRGGFNESINLGPLKAKVVQEFAPLRG